MPCSRSGDIYDLVPTNEFAIESINCTLTPKSQILISPLEFIKMLDGYYFKEEKEKCEKIRIHFEKKRKKNGNHRLKGNT